jgi:photosystem II stability/assembly factor-like uncharacterized protein
MHRSSSLFFCWLWALSTPSYAGWSSQATTNRQDIYSFYGSPDLLFAVGQAGNLLRSTDSGESWSQLQQPSKESLLSVWGDDKGRLYAVGNEGAAISSRDGGSSWGALTVGTKVNLRGVWGSGPEDVYVVGDQGTILHSKDGVAFRALQSGVSSSLNAIWGSGPEDIYVVGDQGTILHSKDSGESWQRLQSGTTELLRGVYGISAQDIFVVGYRRTLLHSKDQGASWSSRVTPGDEWLAAITSVSETELYAVGARGLVFRSNDQGITWNVEKNDTLNPLYAVWGGSSKQVRIGGKGGTIVKLTLPKPTLILLDENNAEGAEAFLNGEKIGQIPTLRQLPPGKYFVEVKRPLFEGFSQWINVESGDTLNVPVSLAPVKLINVTIEGPSGAEVFFNGERKGIAPLTIKTQPGRYLLSLKQPGSLGWSEWIEAKEEDITLSPTMTRAPVYKKSSAPRYLFMSSGVLAGLSLVPVALGAQQLKRANEARLVGPNGDPGDATALYFQHRGRAVTYAVIADAMLLGSVGAALTGYLLRQRDNEEERRFQTTLTPRSLQIGVSF